MGLIPVGKGVPGSRGAVRVGPHVASCHSRAESTVTRNCRCRHRASIWSLRREDIPTCPGLVDRRRLGWFVLCDPSTRWDSIWMGFRLPLARHLPKGVRPVAKRDGGVRHDPWSILVPAIRLTAYQRRAIRLVRELTGVKLPAKTPRRRKRGDSSDAVIATLRARGMRVEENRPHDLDHGKR